MGAQPARGRPRAHPVQPAVRRDGVRRAACTPCWPGTSTRRRWACSPSDVAPGGVPDRRGSTSSAGPGASGRPAVLETLAFSEAEDTDAHPTFDPIGSLLLGLTVPAARVGQVAAPDRPGRGQGGRRSTWSRGTSQIPGAAADPSERRTGRTFHPIGHGEIPPGTPQPYSEFSDDGRTLRVHTPFTPRPFDHTLSNAPGARRRGDQSRAAHHVERQRPAEPPDARLARHGHPRGPRARRSTCTTRTGANGSRRPITR